MQLDINLDNGRGWVNVAHDISEAQAKKLAATFKRDESGTVRPVAEFRLFSDDGILKRVAICSNGQKIRWMDGNSNTRSELHTGTDQVCEPCKCGDGPFEKPFEIAVGYRITCSDAQCPAKVQCQGSAEVIGAWNRLQAGNRAP